MDPALQKLICELQNEKCPPAVMDRVAERIAREKRPACSFRSILTWIGSMACLLAAIAIWQWHVGEKQRVARELAAAEGKSRARRAIVVQQTHEAFGYIGHAFLRVAAHAEDALSKEAVPPLRNSYETIKNKVPKSI